VTADPETTRIVRSWLRTDEHESADRVLRTVLDVLDATPQRRAWWPARRFADMNGYTKLLIATAAAVVVTVVGLNLLPGKGSFGGVGPAPTPSPTPLASPAPSAAASAGDQWPTGQLAIGRHVARQNGVSFSFDLPTDGWSSNRYTGMIEKGTWPAADYRWIGLDMGDIDQVATDPCAGLAAPIGPSVADLATALGTIPGTLASKPVDVTVGGIPAKRVTLTIDHHIACDPNLFWLYGRGSAYPDTIDTIIRVWIFELDGRRHVIHTDQARSNLQVGPEIEQVVDSIRFE
jgi:hypothetical protein